MFYSIVINVNMPQIMSAVPPQLSPIPPKNSRLSIFHLNDLHGQTDNLHDVLLASREFDSKQSKEVDTLKLSGGDNVSGGDSKKNLMIASFMNAMKIDATAVGNHEFDAGAQELGSCIGANKAQFISSNMEIAAGNPLSGKISKSAIKEINGTKYGIVGLTAPDLMTVVTKKEVLNGVNIADTTKSAQDIQQEIDALRAQGTDRIILLSHSGYEFDKAFAQKLSGVDVIISAHSHDAIKSTKEGENLVRSASGEPVLIVQAGDNGRYYGICDIDFDANGIITSISNRITKTRSQKNPLIEYIKNANLGVSPTIANIKEIDPFPENKRKSPCAWSNLLADSMRAELGTDIAIVNSANTRKVPSAGPLTQRDVTESSPMHNKLMATTISEKELVAAIRAASLRSLGRDDGEPGLLQVGGLRYTVDTAGNLLDMNFIDKQGVQTQINVNAPSDKVYTVALDNFVMDGREYPELKLQGREVKTYDFDKDKTAMDFISKNSQSRSLVVKDDGRLKIMQTSMPLQSSNSMQNFLGLTSPKTR